MTGRRGWAFALGTLAILAAGAGRAGAAARADLVLVHGHIITEDPADPIAQALAVRDGAIMAVGADDRVRPLIGPGTRVIDLAGRTVTPGLIDAHAHVLETGERDLFQVDLSNARSVGEIVAAVAARARTAAPGAWVIGGGWDEGKLAERRYPTAAELDAAAPANPVWLENTTGHYGVANSAALRLGGVGPKTPDPPAGTIERTADGAPAGVLKESAAGLVQARIPAYSQAQREAALTHMIERLHAEGMTGFKDPAIDAVDWAAYRAVAARGALSVDACVLFQAGHTLETAQKTLALIRAAKADVAAMPGTSLRVCGAKIFMDGSGAAPTAWMYQDWSRGRSGTAVGNHGYPQTDPDAYRQMVRLFVDADVGIGTHAIGDRAIDWVVDSYAAALADHPTKELRLSIIHANIPTDHAIAVMAELQRRYRSGYPESQGEFAWWIGDIYAANLGPDRSRRLNPFHTYLARGIIWAGGSDSPVTPIAARYGLWASVARQTLRGTYGPTPFGLTEAADVGSALKSYTVWAAPQIDAAARTGVLAPGRSADLAVWDRDPLSVPTDALEDMTCELTLFEGEVVFERKGPRPADAGRG
jgi:predicted amidohydrolase YtcJ